MESLFKSIFSIFVDGALLDDLTRKALVSPLGLTMLLTPLFLAVLFYAVINSVRFNKRRHWLLMGAISFVIVTASFYITCSQMEGLQILRDEENESAGFLFNQGNALFFTGGLGIGLVSFLFYLFFVLLKFLPFSTNTRKTPF